MKPPYKVIEDAAPAALADRLNAAHKEGYRLTQVIQAVTITYSDGSSEMSWPKIIMELTNSADHREVPHSS